LSYEGVVITATDNNGIIKDVPIHVEISDQEEVNEEIAIKSMNICNYSACFWMLLDYSQIISSPFRGGLRWGHSFYKWPHPNPLLWGEGGIPLVATKTLSSYEYF
jgi:hypothetical protein